VVNAQLTSTHAPMYGAATGELNGTIPEQFPINSESFMTTTVTEPYDGTASNVARHKITNITASYKHTRPKTTPAVAGAR